MSLTNNTYVHCTDCIYFKLQITVGEKPTPYCDRPTYGWRKAIPYCDRPTKEYCNDWDMDDSKPYSERPCYWGKAIKL